jgi:hypothetical protein
MMPAKNIVELLFLCRGIPSIFAELPRLIDVSEQIDSGIRESTETLGQTKRDELRKRYCSSVL